MIDGKTLLFGIVADPVAQVRTPEAVNSILQAKKVNGVLVPFHVSPSDLGAFFAAARGIKNLGGFVVTVPHKQAAVSLCDSVSEAARLVGAVNVVCRDSDGKLAGEILDGQGFVAGLRGAGIDPAGKRVLLLGAGGAASAISFALVQSGVSGLGICNRTVAKTQELITRVQSVSGQTDVHVASSDARGYDLVVNATSLGMSVDDPLPMDVATLTPQHCVAEIIMKPEITPLLAAAAARGCQVHYGWPMLSAQADLMAAFMGIEG